MKTVQKGLLLSLVGLLIVLQALTINPNKTQAEANQATLEVIGDNGTLVNASSSEFQDGDTAFDLLIDVVGEENVDYEKFDWGFMINGIKELSPADETEYWGFYINGVSAQVGSSDYKLQPGDKITFLFVNANTKLNYADINIFKDEKTIIIGYPTFSFIGNPTAFDVLRVMLGNRELKYEQYDFGKLITSIDGLESDINTNSFWMFYKNNALYQDGSIDGYKVQNGDVVTFKYETYAPPADDNGDGDSGENGKVVPENIKQALDTAFKSLDPNQLDVWSIISLAQNGKNLPKSYLDSIRKTVKEKQGKIRKITDTEKYVLALIVYGEDPSTFEGYNLLEKIYNGDVTKQGTNGIAYGLLALDAANKPIPQNAKWTKELLVQKLLDSQNIDGGWPLSINGSSEIDITAMMMTALSPYSKDPDVSKALNSAINYLKENVKAGKVSNSNSISQIIIALSALEIDASSFGDKNILSELLTYQTENGGFAYTKGGTSDMKATSDALLALTAYKLSLNGKYVYSFENLKAEIINSAKSEVEEQHELPDTASNMFNILIIGIALIGFAIFLRYRLQRN